MKDDDGSYLWERCYECGHRLRFPSDGCPQCGIHFDGRPDPNDSALNLPPFSAYSRKKNGTKRTKKMVRAWTMESVVHRQDLTQPPTGRK